MTAPNNPIDPFTDIKDVGAFLLSFLEKIFGSAFTAELGSFVSKLETTVETDTNAAVNAEVNKEVPSLFQPEADKVVDQAEQTFESDVNSEIAALEAKLAQLKAGS